MTYGCAVRRDARLHALSRDHHRALVLVRRVRRGADAAEVARRFELELAPHFAIEERVLLPALTRAGRADLATRTAREHEEIRAATSTHNLAAFADLLEAHVRFEERELFPVCESLIADALDQLIAEEPT
jgi:hemerythrin-like domain-containing protein